MKMLRVTYVSMCGVIATHSGGIIPDIALCNAEMVYSARSFIHAKHAYGVQLSRQQTLMNSLQFRGFGHLFAVCCVTVSRLDMLITA